ncbi:MAG: NACHT domain-containing protein [Urechidicola sp.]|nr:NACHT domain-containing protein [Urechidicola sp.]
MDEIEIGKIISDFLTSQISNIVKTGKEFVIDSKKDIQLSLKTIYTDYLERVYNRYGRSKSFFIRDEPINLYEFYIPLGIECNDIKIKSANIKALLNVNSHCIISGTGGAGKSIMLKHLFIDSLKNKKQIPIFIELRDLNSNNTSLFDLLVNTSNSFGLKISVDFFKKALSKGHFILFLDGLDEVVKDLKDILLREINELTIEYPNNSIILSTRPDIKLSELDIFTTFKTLPLSLEQSVSLIEKLPADEKIRSKFIKDLGTSLFEKHTSFLSNPLLLSIMLLTYGYSSDIPNKSSIFYNQAFEALYQRHDSFKGAYKRKRETSLDIQEFSKIFSTFCILSYEHRKFKFTKTEVINYLRQTQEITSIKFDVEEYYNDLLQAVSLLIEDGMSLYFTHRSFQEYFCAKFIVESSKDLKPELLNKYQKYANSDDVFELIRELDKDYMDFEVILPFLENLFKEIGLKKNIGITNYLKFIKKCWERFEFKNDNLYGIANDTKLKEMVNFILWDVCEELLYKEMLNVNQGEWIPNLKKKSVEDGIITVIETKNLKTTDDSVKELYKYGVLFSKKTLKILQYANNEISSRKSKVETSLSELLLNK